MSKNSTPINERSLNLPTSNQISNINAWIKNLHHRLCEIENLALLLEQHDKHLQNDFEYIIEMRGKLDALEKKQTDINMEINALKLIQIIAIKNQNTMEGHNNGRETK